MEDQDVLMFQSFLFYETFEQDVIGLFFIIFPAFEALHFTDSTHCNLH